jgi:hypothetical protein
MNPSRFAVAFLCSALSLAAASCVDLSESLATAFGGSATSRNVSPGAFAAYPDFAKAYRQGGPRARAASVAKGAPSAAGLKRLVASLVDGIGDEAERARLIHDWVALNIGYDFPAFFSGSIPDQGALSVLASGKGVCQGYSNLFLAMCDEAGVPCALLQGFGKGYGRADPFAPMVLDRPNHAWNAVKLRGAWLLVDATWDSGYVTPGVSGFTRRYSTDYFLADPAVFVYDHLPSRADWQLLDPPLDAKAFVDLPALQPGYFSFFERPPVAPRAIKASARAELRFPAPKAGVQLIASLYTYDPKKICTGAGTEIESRGTAFIEGDEAVARFSFPKAGKYVALVFAGGSGGGSYDSVAAYGFEAKSGSASRFPERYGAWKGQYRLAEPLNSPLRAGEASRFRLTLPGVKELMVSSGKDMKLFKPDASGAFDFQYVPPAPDKVFLFADLGGGGAKDYRSLLSYDAEKAR